MTTTDYLINAAFLLIVVRQARERKLDLRSLLVPLGLVAVIARSYLHSIPSAGNDLLLIGTLAGIGLALGVLSGLATRVRAAADGTAMARVGWLAGGLLVAGISSRMVFSFAVSHGAESTIRSFSAAHQITAAAWPAALVLMAVLEVSARVIIVYLRGRRVAERRSPIGTAVGATA